jgi:hypothetical protein
VVLLRRRSERAGEARSFGVAAAVLSLIAFEITMMSSLRGLDLWLAYGAATVAYVAYRAANSRFRVQAQLAGAAAAVALASLAVPKHLEAMRQYAIPPERFKAAADWLAANNRPGEIVATLHWDLFGELFFWNKKNRYLEGMDPIFLYSESPEKFWKLYYLHSGQTAAQTTGTPPDRPPRMQDTHEVLTQDFAARFLLLVKPSSPRVLAHAQTNRRFRLAWEDPLVAIYELGAPAAGAPHPR